MIALVFDATNQAPTLGNQALHLWRWPVPDHDDLKSELSVLCTRERQRVKRLSNSHDRRARIISRAGMRRLLGQYLGLPAADVPIRYGPLGRPHLDCQSTLNFNVSHSANWVAMVLGHADPLGLDIEVVRSRLPSARLINRICSPREQAVLSALSETQRRQAFFRLWTRKEAIMKATGGSVFHAPASIDVSLGESAQPALYKVNSGHRESWQLYHLAWPDQPSDAVGAIAVAAGDWELSCFQWVDA